MVPFGALAFDFFALERWDYSAPLENDQAQWEKLVQEYLALHPKERFAYHQARGWDHHYHSHPELIDDPTIRSMHALLTPEKTRRVLEGRQTADERDLGVRAATASIGWCDLAAWVRVCYDPELENAYNRLVEQTELEDIGRALDSGNVGLDNPLLYGHLAGANVVDLARGIVARIPSLCDGFHGTMDDYDDFLMEGGEWKDYEDSLSPLRLASKRAIALIYVADEAAIRGKHVKLLWLNPYGKCVWSNKIEVTEFPQLVGAFLGGYSLEEAVENGQLSDTEGFE